MLKDWIVAPVAFAAFLAVGTARAEGTDFDQGVDVRSVVESVRAQMAGVEAFGRDKAANWTIMVYINAKNNLEQFGLKDVTGSEYKNALGLAIYLPDWSYNSDYDNLAWAKASDWARFAKWVKTVAGSGGGDDEKQASR